ncbi:chemotaxis protein CheW [Cohnella sp.]|uniref:chemotaxis protein CheW n=1 Tax=Cohnella sp. TaxID=1883426 RepID=UPI00356357AB
MSVHDVNDPILEMYIFESSQLIEQLETIFLDCEKVHTFTSEAINEIFRFMHTIKGSSAMMGFAGISTLAHVIEDLFAYLRDEKPRQIDFVTLCELILDGLDFIKVEIHKIKNGESADGDASTLTDRIQVYLKDLKGNDSSNGVQNKQAATLTIPENLLPEMTMKNIQVSPHNQLFRAVIHFEEDCGMENIRAYQIIHNLSEISENFKFLPGDILENHDSADYIRQHGFQVFMDTDKSYQEVHDYFSRTLYLMSLELLGIGGETSSIPMGDLAADGASAENSRRTKTNDETQGAPVQSSMISVHVAKLDKLLDMVGELVVAEAMVTQNPDLKGLELDNFQKASRQLRKISEELQDMVMSIRMVPVATTFHKMRRLVRDMCKKLGKEVDVEIIGEETEVDKNVIEQLSDPIMHIVRNAIDHGIESPEERLALGKRPNGKITMEARNSGSDVLILLRDDGKGLNKSIILKVAKERGLLSKNENDMTDKEIYNLAVLPGFSTKETVTEYSGRGVGMDVVFQKLRDLGGSITIDSVPGEGASITMKIPLTLAIIDGMNIRVGTSCYTLPTISIKESFRPQQSEIITDPDENEMIMVRGRCYPILRLHEFYSVETEVTDFSKGILIMVEDGDQSICLLADELLGQQQVVVKTLPSYFKQHKKIDGLAGCTLLGDGSISLILDVAELVGKRSLEPIPASRS